MPRTKGSKNKVKAAANDYEALIAQAQKEKEEAEAEENSGTGNDQPAAGERHEC